MINEETGEHEYDNRFVQSLSEIHNECEHTLNQLQELLNSRNQVDRDTLLELAPVALAIGTLLNAQANAARGMIEAGEDGWLYKLAKVEEGV
jgi:hypothetical protein